MDDAEAIRRSLASFDEEEEERRFLQQSESTERLEREYRDAERELKSIQREVLAFHALERDAKSKLAYIARKLANANEQRVTVARARARTLLPDLNALSLNSISPREWFQTAAVVTIDDAVQTLKRDMQRAHKTIIKPYDRTNILADGNCQFDCIARIVSSTRPRPVSHTRIRQDIVDYIDRNKHQYCDFIAQKTPDDVPDADNIDASCNAYIARMRTPREWGDQVTLMAAAEVYGITFVTLDTSNPANVVTTMYTPEGVPVEHYGVLYFKSIHYQLTRF